MKKALKWAGIGFAGLIVLVIIGSMMGGGDETASPPAPAEPPVEEVAAEEPATESEPEEEPAADEAPETVAIGEPVVVGGWSWIIDAAENRGQTITANDGFTDPMETTGAFIYIAATIARDGDDAGFITKPKLVDAGGREFESSSDAIFFVEDSCILEEVNPGLSKQCEWIYEVPSASGVTLQIPSGSLFGGETVSVDLGLE